MSAVREVERRRIRALLSTEMEVARSLHGDDYQLVTPLGALLTNEQYLGAVAAGVLQYLAWDIDSPIQVRLYTEVALIRYQAEIEVVVQGRRYPRARYWHTDAYEMRNGRWQVVWSQATAIT
jgi:hypothetical protein